MTFKEYGAKYRLEHKEQIAARTKQYRLAHKEKYQAKYKAYYEKHREKILIRTKAWKLQNNYGISPEEKYRRIAKQDFKCGICSTCVNMTTGHVDHNHQSRAIRGILCGNCNRVLGLMKDSPPLLRKAADYLQCGGWL